MGRGGSKCGVADKDCPRAGVPRSDDDRRRASSGSCRGALEFGSNERSVEGCWNCNEDPKFDVDASGGPLCTAASSVPLQTKSVI